jgi:hypothetical protein
MFYNFFLFCILLINFFSRKIFSLWEIGPFSFGKALFTKCQREVLNEKVNEVTTSHPDLISIIQKEISENNNVFKISIVCKKNDYYALEEDNTISSFYEDQNKGIGHYILQDQLFESVKKIYDKFKIGQTKKLFLHGSFSVVLLILLSYLRSRVVGEYKKFCDAGFAIFGLLGLTSFFAGQKVWDDVVYWKDRSLVKNDSDHKKDDGLNPYGGMVG